MKENANSHWTIVLLALVVLACSGSVSAETSIKTTPSGPSGGTGGQPFMETRANVTWWDGHKGGPLFRIVGLRIRSGNYIDSIQILYGPYDKNAEPRMAGYESTSKMYGGSGGNASEFMLGPGECITSVGGKYGQYVDSLFVQTNQGRVKQWGGNGGSTPFNFTAPSGECIEGFWGRSGTYIDAIGVVVRTVAY